MNKRSRHVSNLVSCEMWKPVLGNNRTSNVWSTIDPSIDVLGYTSLELFGIPYLEYSHSQHFLRVTKRLILILMNNWKEQLGEIVIQRMSNLSVVKLATYTPQVSTLPPRLPRLNDNQMSDRVWDVFIFEWLHFNNVKFHRTR